MARPPRAMVDPGAKDDGERAAVREGVPPERWQAGNGNLAQPPAPPASGASGNAAGSRPPGSSPKLPRNWQEIGVGDLVLFQECLEDGWYEGIAVEAVGDMFTLRQASGRRIRKRLTMQILSA
jgi:hypothetical protein